MKPTPDVSITGTATRLHVDPDGTGTGGIVLVTYAEMPDGTVGRVWLRIPGPGVEYLRHHLPPQTPPGIPCTPACWTPVTCPTCGRDIPPRGRSVPLEMTPPPCCSAVPRADNPRHLWNTHDDARSYTDPAGWAEHVAGCDQCRGDDQS